MVKRFSVNFPDQIIEGYSVVDVKEVLEFYGIPIELNAQGNPKINDLIICASGVFLMDYLKKKREKELEKSD